MLEILLIVAVVVAIAKIAAADDQSAVMWGVIAVVICGLSLLIPLPFLRILLAGIVTFCAMIGYKMATNK